jgi:hypothetical protein
MRQLQQHQQRPFTAAIVSGRCTVAAAAALQWKCWSCSGLCRYSSSQQ